LALVVLGVVLALIALTVKLLSNREGWRLSGGGVVLIGPIPLIFGAGRGAFKALTILAITLTLIALLLMLTPTLQPAG